MLRISVLGRAEFSFKHLVLYLNSTLALDGALVDGAAERLARLNENLHTVLPWQTLAGHQKGWPRNSVGPSSACSELRDRAETGGCAKAGGAEGGRCGQRNQRYLHA